MRRIAVGVLGVWGMVAGGEVGRIDEARYPFLERKVETARVEPRLQADGVHAGGKKLLLRTGEKPVEIRSGSRLLGAFRYRVSPSEPAWQPFTRFAAVRGAESGEIERECGFGLTKEVRGTFRQKLRTEGGRARLESHWDAEKGGVLKGQQIELFIPYEAVVGRAMAFTDRSGARRVFNVPGEGEWGERTKRLWVNMHGANAPRKFEFDGGSAENSFGIELEGGNVMCIIVFRGADGAFLHFRTNDSHMGKPLAMLVDLGESAVEGDGRMNFFGVDFKANNDCEVAVYNPGGNLLPNPGFESGARHWHHTLTGLMAEDRVTEEHARSGKRGMLLGDLSSFCLPAKAGAKYTLSLYAKSLDGKGGEIRAGMRNGVFKWGSGYERSTKWTLKRGERGWRRLEWTFDWADRGMAVTFGTSAPGRIAIDDVQLEIGEGAGEYGGNPFGTELETDSPDGYYGDEGVAFKARLRLRGPAGAKGEAEVRVENFFGRTVHEGRVGFRLGEDGEWAGEACPEAAVKDKGSYAVRVRVRPEGWREYAEQFRLTRFAYQDGTSPMRKYHQIGGLTWGEAADERNLRRAMLTGACARYLALDDWSGYIRREKAERLHRRFGKYGHLNVEWVFSRHFGEVLAKHGIGKGEEPWKLAEYGEEYLGKMEAAAEEQAKRAPRCRLWVGPNEVGQSWEVTRRGRYEEYAKLMMAVHRGVKKANPANEFAAYSVCNLGEQGRGEIREFLAAGLRVDSGFRFDGVDVHPYRPHPEFPDLDADFGMLFAEMDRLGYGEAKAWALEGAYFYPLCLGEWQGVAPWADTRTKDGFAAMHLPTYDLGWGEKAGAAMLLRYNLVCHKRAPRLAAATSWWIREIDGYNPLAAFAATSAQLSLLGESRYRGEARFAPGARAYLFDDGRGRCTAAVWSFREGMDLGRERGERMRMEWGGGRLEVFDMMGNAKKPLGEEVRGGKREIELPLSNFPVYLRVDGGEGDALLAALNGSRTSGREEIALGFEVKPAGLDRVRVKVRNPLSRAFEGTLAIGEGAEGKAVRLEARGELEVEHRLAEAMAAGRENRVELPIAAESGGKRTRKAYKYRILPVRKCAGKPDWEATPAVAVKHLAMERGAKRRGEKRGGEKDFSAEYRLAWSGEGLHVLVTAKDDRFATVPDRRLGMAQWYDNDSVQLFFDTLGDAPGKAIEGKTGMDENDMSYELLPTNAVGGVTYRRHAPDHQLTGGVRDGLAKNVAEPAARLDFRWDGERGERRYEVFLPARQMAPVKFEAGTTFGLGIKVYDRDGEEGAKQTLSNVPPDEGDTMDAPHLFTTVYLVE